MFRYDASLDCPFPGIVLLLEPIRAAALTSLAALPRFSQRHVDAGSRSGDPQWS